MIIITIVLAIRHASIMIITGSKSYTIILIWLLVVIVVVPINTYIGMAVSSGT